MKSLEWIKERVKINEETGCWEWQGHRDRDGYGLAHLGTNGEAFKWRAHRLAWTTVNGDIPDGIFACHKCDNPQCCNPDHLFLGTAKDNHDDMVAKDRKKVASGAEHWCDRHPEDIPRGSARGQARLTEDLVREIRRRKENRTCSVRKLIRTLSEELGIAEGTISKAMWGATWKHVT